MADIDRQTQGHSIYRASKASRGSERFCVEWFVKRQLNQPVQDRFSSVQPYTSLCNDTTDLASHGVPVYVPASARMVMVTRAHLLISRVL